MSIWQKTPDLQKPLHQDLECMCSSESPHREIYQPCSCFCKLPHVCLPENSGSCLKSPQQNFSGDTFSFPHQTAAQSSLFTGQSSGFACSGAIFSQEAWEWNAGLWGSTRTTAFFFTIFSYTFQTSHVALYCFHDKRKQGRALRRAPWSDFLRALHEHLEDTRPAHVSPAAHTCTSGSIHVKWIILGKVWFGRQTVKCQAGCAHGNSLRDVGRYPSTAFER